MGISTAGIGSGLDVNGIVTSLMGIEQKPLTAVTKQKSTFQSEISAYGTLSSALATFQTAVSGLSTASAFNAQTVTSSNSSVITATSSGNSTVGDYAVTVNQLAKSQKLTSASFATNATVVGTGTLTIAFGDTVGNTFTANSAKTNVVIPITAANNTLAGVRDAINASNSSVSATIVNNGIDNQLVITSKDTGEVNSLKITVADDDGNNLNATGLSQLAYDPTVVLVAPATTGAGKNMMQVQAEQNALLNIDGIAVAKASNTITDVIAGVTLNLLTISATSVNLSVASNQNQAKASVSAFVDAYNKLDATMRSLTNFAGVGKASGVLLGDATIRSVTNQIKSVMTKGLTGDGSITSLSQIGIAFQRDGKLALDSTKLSSALTTNFGDIAALFTTSAKATDAQISYTGSTSKTQAGTYAVTISQLGTSLVNTIGTVNGVAATSSGANLVGAVGDPSEGLNLNVAGGATGPRGTVTFTIGYAAQLDSVLKNLLSTDGILASRTDGIKSSVTRLDKQAVSISARLVAIEARYRAQYTRLDTLMASMSTSSTFLTQQIASLNANK